MNSAKPERHLADDLKGIIEKTGLDIDEYLEIYEIFKENFRELMEDLEKGLADDDSEKVMHAAHTIKGATSNIGFMDLSELAQTIQTDPGNKGAAMEIIPKMRELFKQIDEEMVSISKTQVG